jgi:hypothetical protein
MPKGEASLFQALGVLSLSLSLSLSLAVPMMYTKSSAWLSSTPITSYMICKSCVHHVPNAGICQLLSIDHKDFPRHSEAQWGINYSSCGSVGKTCAEANIPIGEGVGHHNAKLTILFLFVVFVKIVAEHGDNVAAAS